MEKITLFRGDAEKIREFDVSKTNKWCAVGQGVYLTNNLKVAKSYMDKGSDKRNGPTILFAGCAKNRGDAYEKAFIEYVRAKVRDENLVPGSHHLYWKATKDLTPDHQKQLTKFMDRYREEFQQLVSNRFIVANYTRSVPTKGADPYIEVTLDKVNIRVGYITEFEFERKVFDTAMFKVEGYRNGFHDKGFWEIAWDEHDGKVGTPYADRASYISGNYGRTPDMKHRWTTLRNIIEPYGYRGFEYMGGIRTASNISHRAFCVWHDDWLNDHKTRRFR